MLTIVILAGNEAANLRDLLPCLGFADKVLVVDDYSKDETAKICADHKVDRILHRLHGDYASARNAALDRIRSGWVLFLDADERLPEETVKEIKRVIEQEKIQGFYFKRIDVFYGKKLFWGDSGSVRLLRLGRADAGRWLGKVHEAWQIDSAAEMKHELMHYAHDSVREVFVSVRGYAQIRAKELYENKQYWNLWEQLFYPPFKFLYLFLIRLGMFDGWRGLVMSVAMAWHSFLVRWNLWDLPWLKRSGLSQVWRILMVLPVVLLPFGQLLRGFPFPIYVHEVFMILAGLVTGGLAWKEKRRPSLERLISPLGVFCLVLGSSFLLSIVRGFEWDGGMQLIRWYLYVAYLWSLLWGVKNGLRVSIGGLLSYWGTMTLGLGWLQYVLLPDVRFLALLGWDDHYYRMVGTLFDPNYLGLLLILVFWWGFLEMKPPAGRVLAFGAAMGLVATFSRASWLTFVLGLGWYLARYKRNWLILVVMSLAAVIYVLLPKPGGEGINIFRAYSITNRIDNWVQTGALIKNNLWTGIGFNQYANVLNYQGKYGAPYLPKSPDNSWLFVLVTTGIPGLMAFIWLLVRWWQEYTSPVTRLSLGAILIHGMANNSFFYPFVLLWWWLLMADLRQKSIGKN